MCKIFSMKTPSDDLFNLIKSLTKTEKRYFRLYSSGGAYVKAGIYLKLFDVIDAQNEYNEVRLKQAKGLRITNIEKAKRYLSNLILKALNSYYSESIFDLFFKERFKDLYVLFQKGLCDQCLKAFERLKKQVVLYERYTELVELYHFERKLADIWRVDIEDVSRKAKEASDILVAENELWHLSQVSYKIVHSKQQAADETEIRKVNGILNSPLLLKGTEKLSFIARINFNKIHIYCYTALRDLNKVFNYLEIQLKLYRKNPHQIKQFPSQYISTINNIIVVCDWTNRNKEFNKYLKEFEKIETRYRKTGNTFLAVQIFSKILFIEFSKLYISGEFHKIHRLLPEIENKLRRYSAVMGISQKQIIYLNVASSFLGAEDYADALVWLNKILVLQKTGEGLNYQVYARLLNVLIHYEMGNTDLLDSAIRSAYRFSKNRGMLNEYESCILGFIIRIRAIENKTKRIDEFKIFKQKMVKIAEEIAQKKPYSGFDFISWIDSKIQNRPFAEIIREKVKKANL